MAAEAGATLPSAWFDRGPTAGGGTWFGPCEEGRTRYDRGVSGTPRDGGWLGRVFFGSEHLLYAGPMAPTALHAHHAWQIVLGVEADMCLVDGHGGELAGRAAVIPPDAPHGRTRPARGALVYVDPDGLAGRRLRRTIAASARAPDWAAAARPLEAVPLDELPAAWPEADRLHAAVLAALVGVEVRPRPVHPGVLRVLRRIPERLDDDLRLATLAREARLSPGRLGHVFSAEVGIPLRRYVLWARMRRVAEHLQRGGSVTDAAHAAGFADGAHMSNAFRRMFGLTPSEVAGVVEWVLPPR